MNLEESIFLKPVKKLFGTSDYVRWGILIGITMIFTIFIFPNLIIKEQSYKIGDVAERDIKATKDFLIEDKDATAISRRQAVENVLTVYDHDVTLVIELTQKIKAAFDDLRSIFETEKNKK